MKRIVIAAAPLLASCDPHQVLADDLLWLLDHREAYQLPDDDAAATREVFTATTRDGVPPSRPHVAAHTIARVSP